MQRQSRLFNRLLIFILSVVLRPCQEYLEKRQNRRLSKPLIFSLSVARHNWGLEKASVFDHGDREIIEHNLKQLEKKNPTDSDVQVLLGRFYAAQNELPRAIQYYQTTIKLNPDAAEAYFRLGVVYDQQDRSSEAMEMFRKAF